MTKTVSVVIPFYEHVEWLVEAVESVLNQTYPIKEIIVINDGSKEDISSFLAKYANHIVYTYKNNEGPASARNLGIELSTGDYIAFLDSDDLWLPEKTEKQIAYMQQTQTEWSHTAYETFDTFSHSYETIKKIDIKNFDGTIFPKILYSNPLATPGIIIRGNLLRNNKKWRFNNAMRYGEDQYLWISIAPYYEIAAVNDILVRVRMRGGNAALRARVQLLAKVGIYNTVLRNNKELCSQVCIRGKIAFMLCIFGEKVLSFFERIISSNNCLEYLSRILYIIPWILFKVSIRKLNRL